MGVRPVTVHKFFSQGSFQNTGNTLDVAIEGQGFFKLNQDGNDVYTRAGNFKPDNNGRLVNSNGYPLQPEFTIPNTATTVTITEKGRISALDANGQELAGADIPIYNFVNPAGLKAMGRNLYVETDGSGAATQGTPGDTNFGTLAQGYLETSNVEMVDEMVGLIIGQRAYEVNSKAMTTSDTILQTAINVKR
jgi:flagellar basal-body rod protein FlgG